jgi:uncharacterized membrane protein
MNKIFFILAVTVLSSCNYSRMKKPLQLDEGVRKISSPDEITFKMVNEAVIQPMCLSCHSEAGGNRGGLNLENFENVFKNSHGIRLEVAGGTMPPRQQLSAEQIKLVTDWIDAGAHENGKVNAGPQPPAPQPSPTPAPVEPPPVNPPTPTPAPVEPPPVLPPAPAPAPAPTPAPTPIEPPPVAPPTPSPHPVEPPPVVPPVPQPPAGPTFSEVMNKVIKTNCFQCHTEANGNRGGLNLETYQNIFDNRHAIKFEVENGTMPTRRGTPLTTEQKQMLLTWIEQGAKP